MQRLRMSRDRNDTSGVAPPFPTPAVPARASIRPVPPPHLPAPVSTGAAPRDDASTPSSEPQAVAIEHVTWDEV